MKRLINVSMILVLLLGFLPARSAVAEAQLLWEQLPNEVNDAPSSYDSQFIADDFILTEASSINQIEIWNRIAVPVETYYYFYANTTVDGVNVPGLSHAYGMITSVVTDEEDTICSVESCQFRHTITLGSPVELPAGHYWLSVFGWYGSGFSWSYGYAPTELPTFASEPPGGPWTGTFVGGLAYRLLGPQVCLANIEVQNSNNDGPGSLRQAIIDVCPGGIITFASSLSGATITLASQLTLDKNLTIDGSELTEKVSISGNNLVRVFQISPSYTVTMNSLIIANGNQTDINGNGGGINNQGTLTINNCSLVNNTTSIGGGIYNGGTLSVNNSSLMQNSATGTGGALVNIGTATFTGCTISENQAPVGAGVDESYGTLTVRDSTFSANVASSKGGGIYISSGGAQASIFGSTFINNTAGEMGGGAIVNHGTASVVNSTFTGNVLTDANARGSAINNLYGDLTLYNSTLSGNTGFVTLNNDSNSTMSLANTIIANTTSGWDCSTAYGTLTESINNWVSDGETGETCGASNFGDPMLAALEDNGGPTQTIALQAASPAIDAGDDTICIGTLVAGVDQRGVTRPQGEHCDIGAYEYEEPVAWGLVVNATDDVSDGTCDATHCSLREAIVAAASGDTITFDSSLDIEGGATITLTSQLILDKDLTIDGSALTNKVSISGNNQYLVFSIPSLKSVMLDSLIITGGNNDNGGGINNLGTLTLANSSLVNNHAVFGGGIYSAGTLSLINSSLLQNSSEVFGGALHNAGSATLTGCTISNNQSAVGGGIDTGNGGTSTVRDSTFTGNSATDQGGGINVVGLGEVQVFGSTFVNNTAGSPGGGGINNWGTTSVINSTFTGNVSTGYGNAINNTYGANLTLYNSTLSGNTGLVTLYNENASMSLANTIIANTINGYDCDSYSGTLTMSTNNWLSDGDSPFSEKCGATLFGDPMLAALEDNGGSTQTMALQAGSGAIDAGDDTICSGTLVGGVDQREVTRPQGAHCDIGAFELESSDLWQQLPGGESQHASYAGNQSVYDDFVLTQTATIRQVEFWSSTPDPIAINFGFYENSSDGSNDIPGADLLLGTTSSFVTTVEDPAVCSQAYCTYRHSFMTYLTLDPGHYWISIYGAYELYWSSAADMTGSYVYYPYGAVLPTLGIGNLAFRLLDYYTPMINEFYLNPSPSIVGMEIWANVEYSDSDSISHTGVIDWGDGTVENANYCTSGYCNFPFHTYAQAGTYPVQAWVTDDAGHTGTLSIQHDVSYFMVPPYTEEWLASDTNPTTILLEGGAVEGHTQLTFNISVAPVHGTMGTPSSPVCEFLAEWGIYFCTASVVYTPPSTTPTYNDYDNFSYTIDDGLGNVSSAGTVPLWVAPNTPPTAQPATVQVSTILPTTIMLTATDPDFHNSTIDRLSIFIDTVPTQGTLSEPRTVNCYFDNTIPGSEFGVCNYQVTYTPYSGVTGTADSFTFSVFDTHQYSLPGSVSLELHAPVTWTVNTTEDVVDESGCDESHCSLREAVAAAWNGDIIEFNLASQATIVLDGNDILIDKNLVINGPGADLLSISGGAEIADPQPELYDRAFTVGGFELMPVTVIINGLTIRDGRIWWRRYCFGQQQFNHERLCHRSQQYCHLCWRWRFQ